MTQPPTISITISTGQGWPAVRDAVCLVEAAAAEAGGEVVVTDGSGRAVPGPGVLGPMTTWRSFPGASVFQLRRTAYQLSAGPIIAITEDHCRVPLDWASRMLAAHAAHPEAAVIGGAVENGAVGNDMDWASFLVVQATVAAPIASGPATKLAGAVNASYKREALESIDDFDGMGKLDVLHQRDLGRSDHGLDADDSIRVVHDQSLWSRARS